MLSLFQKGGCEICAACECEAETDKSGTETVPPPVFFF